MENIRAILWGFIFTLIIACGYACMFGVDVFQVYVLIAIFFSIILIFYILYQNRTILKNLFCGKYSNTNICYLFIALLLFYTGILGFKEYGFYLLLRICVTLFSLYAANLNYTYKRHSLFVLPYILTAILFNPIIMIELEIDTWESIDLIVAVFVLVDMYLFNHK